jgi:energy-coupling factor transporter ATP-binding protein EcfA2
VSFLELRGVSKSYGEGAAEVHALEDVNLFVERGSLVAVMGPSGSGKSTLLTIAGSLEEPTSGEVAVDGAVTLVVDDSDAWEFGAGDAGVNPGSDTGPGDPLSQFGREVESSIGTGEGGLAMMGLADPYGRLDLAENMITNATEIGTGMVDGTAVTTYAVTINVENEANQVGLSPEQQATIDQALTFLQQEGYTGTSEVVSVDGAGYIREIKSTVTFASGASVVGDQTYSDFGCAGAVTPGDRVVQPAAAGCVSPDQPGAVPTSVPTTATGPPTTTSTTPSTTTTSSTSAPGG